MNKEAEKYLITLSDPRSPVSEAYRTLRTNLSFYSLDNPLRTLVVTSPAADDGKSTTVANLAVTMAQSGRKTILVDCDLRRPSLHTFFGLPAEPGLTNMLLDDDEPPLQETGVENLWLLASGPKPPNPADLLGARKVDRVIERLKEMADVILFDAPPVVAVTDAAVLGAKVDGVLLVISAGKTRREHAERAKELLQKAHVRLVGVTLTNAPKDDAISGYYG
ncbi:MAG: polysaccharide biosynthesis tyrosine autokinase [Chloroflexi bacterium]|nr:MAG: polysaccharide biosynthesis tyrosine autokinase [Chloroflexota bacterium]